ncbi:MAG: 30S ribosomal protein S6 [SAR86 cluster bacterium]|uniref:Small ribosomal subunit protein bS6 n=1 Tax=SAR86 cluster bacterium TaxID=2030880 RepID=A0A520N4N5_9GAMM|nr:MAG: 30S ribosomal protein S6 [SAR86 cluster bacterium]
MKKYEAVIILNPNLSSKVDSFIKDFEKLLKANTFNIKKMEDIGRRQLSYSINNHNKGHYLIFNIEGNAENIIDIENKIKYNESIIRHLFISVKEHDGEDSQLLVDSRNKKSESEDEESNVKNEVKKKPADVEKKNEEKIVSEEESIEYVSSDSIEEDSKDE